MTFIDLVPFFLEPVRTDDGRGDHCRNDDCEYHTDFHIQHLLLSKDNAR